MPFIISFNRQTSSQKTYHHLKGHSKRVENYEEKRLVPKDKQNFFPDGNFSKLFGSSSCSYRVVNDQCNPGFQKRYFDHSKYNKRAKVKM